MDNIAILKELTKNDNTKAPGGLLTGGECLFRERVLFLISQKKLY